MPRSWDWTLKVQSFLDLWHVQEKLGKVALVIWGADGGDERVLQLRALALSDRWTEAMRLTLTPLATSVLAEKEAA